ncbi:response regulator receiver domain-containing protein [Paraburkholderia sp. BL18I3N2]|uniref:response regulator n=1 Tax=Paraburkholderia sp. BL18I3N2 TaxID=1938799 RepID=UPI000D43F378|nr:response regulator [Paraburkholderia sp. BL18I3N2]PRX33409.1 response regulator receiver domain-containing protein [Paraburkholderia sp. BL18I3N2]
MARILLVDDDDESLWMLQLVFERSGHRVLLADSGEPALALAGRHLPDLTITDWNMPGLDGLGLCEWLKFYPSLAQIPVVMTSGEWPPKDKSALWNAFFSKPVDLEALESAVDSLLARRLCCSKNRVNVPAPAPSRWAPMPSKYWV